MNLTTSKQENTYQTLMAIISAVALLLFSVNCAFFEVAVLSYVTLAAFFAFATIATRSKGTVITLAVFAVLSALSAPVSMVSYLLSGIGVIATVSAAIRKGQYLTLIAIPAAYGVCFAVSGDPVASLGALVFLPPAIVMGILLRKKAKRGTLVAIPAGCLLLLPVISLVSLAYAETGTVSISFFTDNLFAIRDALIPELAALFEEAGMPNTEEVLLQSFNLVLRILPALCIIVCEILAYLAGTLGLALADTDKENPLPFHTRLLRMETASAIVFLIMFLLAFAMQGMSGNAGVVWVSALNLCLILMPALALQELIFFAERFRAGQANILFPIIFVILSGIFLPFLLALMGAVHVIRNNRSRRVGNGDDI